MKLPNKAEKYIKELQNTICNFYSYNPQYSVILPSKVSNYNAIIMKDDIAKNGCDLVEGIYKGDYYTIGLKKSKDTYYLIYFEGADNSNWKEGDIKASLTATATPGLYKAIWFGAWKQKMDMTVIFSEGLMTVIDGDYKTNYNARVEVTDEHNDLAIIKITDSNFKSFASLPYAIRKTNANIGEDCFVLGYPLISTMGMDIKLTNGIISAKTGYQGDVSQYQISAPIQPGNSGGPDQVKIACNYVCVILAE